MNNRAGHRSLAREVIERARRAKIGGATVFHAVEGYGASGQAHRAHRLHDDEPASLVIVEEPGRLAAFVDANRDLLSGLLVAVDDVEVLRFSDRRS